MSQTSCINKGSLKKLYYEPSNYRTSLILHHSVVNRNLKTWHLSQWELFLFNSFNFSKSKLQSHLGRIVTRDRFEKSWWIQFQYQSTHSKCGWNNNWSLHLHAKSAPWPPSVLQMCYDQEIRVWANCLFWWCVSSLLCRAALLWTWCSAAVHTGSSSDPCWWVGLKRRLFVFFPSRCPSPPRSDIRVTRHGVSPRTPAAFNWLPAHVRVLTPSKTNAVGIYFNKMFIDPGPGCCCADLSKRHFDASLTLFCRKLFVPIKHLWNLNMNIGLNKQNQNKEVFDLSLQWVARHVFPLESIAQNPAVDLMKHRGSCREVFRFQNEANCTVCCCNRE